MMPKVVLALDTGFAPQAISRLRMRLLVAPFPAATLANQMAAVAVAVLLLRTVRSRLVPVPPRRPSIVTLSAPLSLIIAPAIVPSMILVAPTGLTVTLAYEAAPV